MQRVTADVLGNRRIIRMAGEGSYAQLAAEVICIAATLSRKSR